MCLIGASPSEPHTGGVSYVGHVRIRQKLEHLQIIQKTS